MATQQELLDQLEVAIGHTNRTNDDILLSFKADEDTDIALRDGTVVASMDKRVKEKVDKFLGNGLPANMVVVGDSTLDVFARDYSSVFVLSPETYTTDFKTALQNAVVNHKTVLIRGQHNIDLNVTDEGVVPQSGCEIVFEPDAKITVNPNNLERYYLFDLRGTKDVTFRNPTCVGDREEHLGTTGQWGHCFNVQDCENISIHNPNLSNFWGDGIYINGAKNTKIYYPKLSNNRRQGMSIIKCEELDVYFADIENTNGQDPAYGVDLEVNWAGEHCTGIRFHNPTFKNNGEGGSYRAGFCVSTHRAKYVESGDTEIPITNVEVELYNPKFYGDALIVSAYIDQVHGYFKCYNPEFYNSNLSALLFNNHQSRNFFSEIHNPKFYDCVQNQTTIYENVMQFSAGSGDVSQTNGTCNIKVFNPEIYASAAASYKNIAIRNLTKTTYTEDLKNVEITELKCYGFTIPFTLANGAVANTPESTFKLTYANDSSYINLDHASNISEILDRTRLEYRGTTVQATCYLNDTIPITDTEFTIKNNSSSNIANLTINFGNATTTTNKFVYGLSNGATISGIVLEKGAEITLIKKSSNAFELVRSVGRIVTPQQKGVSMTYDPESIPANSSVTTTVELQGVVVGQPVLVGFSQYNLGVKIEAVVSAVNAVTVEFTNKTDAAINLASGTLTVKAI